MAEIFVIKNLVLDRGGEQHSFPTVTASWGVTGKSSWGYDGWYDEEWHFNASKNMSSTVIQQTGTGAATGDIVWTRNGDGYHSTAYCCYNRSKYHPVTSGRYLKSVTCKVIHGSGGKERSTSGSYAFKPPRKPEISEAEYDSSNHRITFTITTDAGSDQYERHDTYYRVTRQDSSNLGGTYKSEKNVVNWTSTTDTSKTVTYDYAGAASLAANQWVRITIYAYARGLAGDSATVKRTYVYARPPKAAITSITKSGATSNDYVTVKLKTNATATAPVDSVKLQRLKDSTITSAAAAGLADGWADVSGAVDNGNCTGLTDMVENALPTVQTHTWYRLVTTHGAFSTNSVPVEAKCLYQAKSPQQDDVVKFISIKPGDDGSSIVARLAWNNDDSNTTQISWSTYEDAWESTEQPTIYDVTWEESSHPTGYSHSAMVSIRGLSEGVDYYVRARRALVTSDTSSFGRWCYPQSTKYPITAVSAPEDVTLFAPAAVERGSGIDCSWSFYGSEQKAWQLFYLDGSNRKELVSGDGPASSAVIPASAIEGLSSLALSVSVTTGGDWASSGYVPVTVEDAPELSMTVSQTLTAQPVSMTFTCTSARTNLTIYITSNGVSTATPTGSTVQADGDVVWSDVVKPIWAVSGNVYTATVTAPPGLDLYDGAVYTITAVASDTVTLLSSDWTEAKFTVAWAHNAYPPSLDTTINVDGLAATITPATPVIPDGEDDEVADTDVCDVYRNTVDGAYLIAKDVPFGTPVTDRYAPFSSRGDLYYTLCTRTVDGDLSWADYPFASKHSALRIDFGGESIELPYNLKSSDSWQKNFKLREHLDGTKAGYWNAGSMRKSSLSTDVVKVTSEETRRSISALAKHAGACFVRTPNGCAYPADVQVNSYDVSYDSLVVPVSISATEIAMTDAFRIQPEDWGEPTEDDV